MFNNERRILLPVKKRADIKMQISIVTIMIVLSPGLVSTRIIDDTIYTNNNTCYLAEYDIVDIHAPVYFFNKTIIFIVQADINKNEYKGLYVLVENDKGKLVGRKILENGQCIASNSEGVYFGASNGIYKYNFTSGTAYRYGSITANIKDIATDNTKDLLYIITEDSKLYLITEKGQKMALHDTINNVQEIVTDNNNNLYYYTKHEDEEKHLTFYEKYSKPKVMVGNNISDITGLPDIYTYMKLASFVQDYSALVVMNNKVYSIFPNGSSIDTGSMFLDRPSAYSLDLVVLQFYGHNKKLYCYSVLAGIVENLFKEIRLEDLVPVIVNSIAEAVNNFSFV